jgi:CubicO group peptidase (beta-lactamase class C family)
MHRRLFLQAVAAAPFAKLEWKSDLATWMKATGVPSATVGCVQNFEPAWTHAVGADTSTLYQAASLTKQVTAHAALTLTRRGQLDLDRPLVSWVDDLPNPVARTVTPRQVLSHSSGFPNWRYVSEGQPLPELVPAFAPGSQYQYSGEGYFYLQRVLEEIADRGFGEVVRELVFEPFGMKSSTLVWDPETLKRTALPHNRKGELRTGWDKSARFTRSWAQQNGKNVEQIRYADSVSVARDAGKSPLPDSLLPNGAASMVTCAEDYAKFLGSALRNPRIAEQQVKINEYLGWGLGWAVEHYSGRTYLWQWGDNGGYKNFVLADPAAGNALFVFTNGDGGARVYDRIITHATGQEHPALLWLQ